MTPEQQADLWKRVSDRMEEHANRKDVGPSDVRTLAGLSLFAWEISHAYRLQASAEKYPAAAE